MSHVAPQPPPPVMFDTWVSHWARLGRGVHFSGRSRAYMDSREIGRAPCLAIGRSFADSSVLLLQCGPSWHVRGYLSYSSIREAKAGAERSYPGVGTYWVATGLTPSRARRHRRELWAGQTCGFCGAIPPEVATIIQKGPVAICDACIRECFEIIASKGAT